MKVILNYIDNLHFTATARHFKNIRIDEPESFHGSDKGPSPVEYFLIGVGGCISSAFVYCLQKHRVEIDNLEVVISGKVKHVPPKKRLRLVNVDINLIFTPKSEIAIENINKYLIESQEYCVLSNSIFQENLIKVKVLKKEKIE